jgi:hypothetical protein
MEFDTRAYLALLLFVPLGLGIIASSRRSTFAIACVYLGGLLFLPELAAFDFPLLPPMDKNGFAAVVAFVGILLTQRSKLRQVKPMRGVDLFLLIILAGNVGTALTNTDPIAVGNDYWRPDGTQVGFRHVLPSLSQYDILSMTVRDVISIFLPFFVGRSLFRDREDGEALLKAIVIFGLVYVPLMLLEMRLSPQLHRWVYGYAPNLFFHNVRGEGFKAVVFLNNGLPVAMFILAATISSGALFKNNVTIRGIPAVVPLGVLWMVLALSRNVGATVYSLGALPILLLSRGRLAARASLVLVTIVVAYPALRGSDRLPVYEFVEKVAKYSEERAHSVNTRFVNEDALYERAEERLWFGWGGYGRNRIYDAWGRDASITDGEWIIRIGSRGLVGFIGSFGLLLWPILMAVARGSKIRDPKDRKIVDALTLIVALNALDLLPNGLFTQMPYFLAGALAGLTQGMTQASAAGSRARGGQIVVQQQ